jgi:hypothetical protein
VPQATYTNSTALTSHGDVIGRYIAGTVASGYLLREGVYSTIAFPGATFTGSAAMNERGDIVGRYQTADSTSAFHAFLLSGFQTGCVAYVPRVALSSGVDSGKPFPSGALSVVTSDRAYSGGPGSAYTVLAVEAI